MPLGLLLELSGLLVLPAFGGGDAQVGDAGTGRQGTHFRVLTQVTDENDLVDAASHGNLPLHNIVST
jgi:hypothetical protein